MWSSFPFILQYSARLSSVAFVPVEQIQYTESNLEIDIFSILISKYCSLFKIRKISRLLVTKSSSEAQLVGKRGIMDGDDLLLLRCGADAASGGEMAVILSISRGERFRIPAYQR